MHSSGTQGEKILFLHGGSVRYNSYLPLISELSKNNIVYYCDLPSHGESKNVNNTDEAVNVLGNEVNLLFNEKLHLLGIHLEDIVLIELHIISKICINYFFLTLFYAN